MKLTPEEIDEVWNGMEGGPEAFLKQFGYQQFAEAIAKKVAAKTEALNKSRDTQIHYLKALVKSYGPKSLQYDIEHPMDGLNTDTNQVGEYDVRGPLTYPQRQDAGYLMSNFRHLGNEYDNHVITAIAVQGYINGFRDAKE